MEKNKPLISCIMPAYNAARFLRIAIDSILAQTYENFELIIVNDGSSDDTEKIILSYNDPRIVYLKNEKNIKLIKTLNRGIDIARGDFISRMDSDDQALPTLFETELKEFSRHQEVGIVNTLTYHMSEDGKHVRKNRYVTRLSSQAISVICPLRNVISHPGVMVRTELMKKYKYRDDERVMHLEDKDLWCRMFMDGVICRTIKKRLLRYRTSPSSINAVFGRERLDRSRDLKEFYLRTIYGYEKEVCTEMTTTISKKIGSCLAFFIFLLKNNRVSICVFGELVKWLLNDICFDLKHKLIKK